MTIDAPLPASPAAIVAPPMPEPMMTMSGEGAVIDNFLRPRELGFLFRPEGIDAGLQIIGQRNEAARQRLGRR